MLSNAALAKALNITEKSIVGVEVYGCEICNQNTMHAVFREQSQHAFYCSNCGATIKEIVRTAFERFIQKLRPS